MRLLPNFPRSGLALAAAVLLASACSSETSFQWGACFVEDPIPDESCAVLSVPLDRSRSAGPRVDLLVRRVEATEPVRGRLFVLVGGPGQSVIGTGRFMERMATLAPQLDVYLVGRRGSFDAGMLGCLASMATPDGVSECVEEIEREWGAKRLAGFSTSEAARDVVELIARTDEGQGDVFLHGVSYGTYWANRVFQVAPGLVTAAVLDSPVHPGVRPHGGHLALGAENGFRALMESCLDDMECAARFGDDPHADSLAMLEGLGSCPGIEPAEVRRQLNIALESPQSRAMIPAMVHRLARCDAEDREAFAAWVHWLAQWFESAPRGPTSDALYVHVVRSEFLERAGTQDEHDAVAADTVTGWSEIPPFVWERWSAAYADTEFPSTWAADPPPILMVTGEFDRRTDPGQLDRYQDEHGFGPDDRHVQLRNGSHSMLNPFRQDPEVLACSESIWASFIADPTAPLDTTCNDAIAPPAFGSPTLAEELLGLPSPWYD